MLQQNRHGASVLLNQTLHGCTHTHKFSDIQLPSLPLSLCHIAVSTTAAANILATVQREKKKESQCDTKLE